MREDGLFEGAQYFIRNEHFYPNGDIYLGQWTGEIGVGKGPQRHGRGSLIVKNQGIYEGFFENDKFSIAGRYIYGEGAMFEGGWKGGFVAGMGTTSYSNGDIYTGDHDHGRNG